MSEAIPILGYIHTELSNLDPIPFFEGENIIGRNPTKTKVAIRHPSISERHLSLHVRKGKIYIKDIGSKNGTFLGENTDRLEKNTEIHVKSGHSLLLADIKVSFKLNEE